MIDNGRLKEDKRCSAKTKLIDDAKVVDNTEVINRTKVVDIKKKENSIRKRYDPREVDVTRWMTRRLKNKVKQA